MNNLKNFFEIFDKIFNNQTPSTEKISDEEYPRIMSLINVFKYIVSFDVDNNAMHKNTLNEYILSNSYLTNIFVPNTSKYDEFVSKKGQCIKDLISGKVEEYICDFSKTSFMGFIMRCKYVMEGNNILQYTFPDIDFYNRTQSLGYKVLYSEEEFKSLNGVRSNGDSYYVPVYNFIKQPHKIKTANRNFPDICFIKDGKYFYEKVNYQNNGFANIKEERTPLMEISIFDENNKKVSLSNFNCVDIIRRMRNKIAHNELYTVAIKEPKNISGKCFKFISNDKTYKVYIPYILFHIINQANKMIMFENKNKYCFLYFPNISKDITQQTCDDYLKTVLNISIELSKPENEIVVQEVIYDILDKIREKKGVLDITGIKEVIKNSFKLSGISLKICNISINSPSNTNSIKSRFFNEELLYYYKKKNNEHFAETLIQDVLNFYLNSEELSNEKINKTVFLKPKIFKSSSLCENIRRIITYLFGDKYKDLSVLLSTINEITKAEYYFTFCLMCGFANLITNSFFDNIKMIDKHLVFDISNAQKKQEVNSLNFKSFVVLDNNGQRSVKDEEKIDILKMVRNGLAHSNVWLKYSKDSKYDSNFIGFTKDENSSKVYLQITCRDFYNFITQPIFANNQINDKTIITNTRKEELKDVCNFLDNVE